MGGEGDRYECGDGIVGMCGVGGLEGILRGGHHEE